MRSFCTQLPAVTVLRNVLQPLSASIRSLLLSSVPIDRHQSSAYRAEKTLRPVEAAVPSQTVLSLHIRRCRMIKGKQPTFRIIKLWPSATRNRLGLSAPHSVVRHLTHVTEVSRTLSSIKVSTNIRWSKCRVSHRHLCYQLCVERYSRAR